MSEGKEFRAESPLEVYLMHLGGELAARRLPTGESAELVEEIRHHLECAVEDAQRRGESREAAEAAAIAGFGPAQMVAADWIRADRITLPTSALGLVSAGGTVLGTALGVPAGLWVLPFFEGELMLPVVGCIVGLALGLLQWLLVRRIFATRAGWVLGTALGAAGGLTMGTVVVEAIGFEKGALVDELAAVALIGAVLGGSIGWLQWRFGLPSVRRPQAWVTSNALALAAGLVVGSLLAIVGFGDLRTLAGLATVTVTGGCALGCAGSLTSRPYLFARVGER